MPENESPHSLPAAPKLPTSDEFVRQTAHFPVFAPMRWLRSQSLRSVDLALDVYDVMRHHYESVRKSHEDLCAQWRSNGPTKDLTEAINRTSDRAEVAFKKLSTSIQEVQQALQTWSAEKPYTLQVSSNTWRDRLTSRNQRGAVTALRNQLREGMGALEKPIAGLGRVTPRVLPQFPPPARHARTETRDSVIMTLERLGKVGPNKRTDDRAAATPEVPAVQQTPGQKQPVRRRST